MKHRGLNTIQGKLCAAMAAAIGLLTATTVHAAIATWDAGGVANDNWDYSSSLNVYDNWLSNVLPAATDDVIIQAVAATGNSISLNGNRTVNSLTLNQTVSQSFTLDNNTLTVTSGKITRTPASLGVQYVNSAVLLGAPGVISSGSTSGSLYVAAISDAGNAYSLSASGSGTAYLTGANTYSGATQVLGGTLGLLGLDGTALNTSGFYLNGGALSLLGGAGSVWARHGNNNDRIGDSTPLVVNDAGTFHVENGASAQGTVSENAGPITLNTGQGTIETKVTGTGATAVVTLTADSLTRANHATALVRGTNLGSTGAGTSRIVFDVTTPAAAMLGGGGGANTTTISVIPWLAGDTGGTGGGNTLVTYDAVANSLRPLNTSTEFVTSNTGTFPATTSSDNVQLLAPSAVTTYTLAGITRINALVLGNATHNSSVSGAATLTLGSGVLAAYGSANETQGISTTALDFAGNEGFIYYLQGNNRSLTISANLTDTAGKGITFTVTPTNNQGIRLTGANTFTGPATINSGAVWGENVNALPAAAALTVRSGGDFRANVGQAAGQRLTVTSITGAGYVGIESASVSLNIGGDQTVGANGAITMTGGFLAPGDYPALNNMLNTGVLTLRNRSTGTPAGNLAVNLYNGTLNIDLASADYFDALALTTAQATPNVTLMLSGGLNPGTDLAVTLGFAPIVGDLFKIVDVAGSNLSTGMFFDGLSVTSVFGANNYNFDILYNSALGGGTGNDIVLRLASITTIPEPAGVTLLLFASLALLRRRRR